MKLVIIDYGLGNLRSVSNAFIYLGVKAQVTSNPMDVLMADGVILPGVGAFADGMAGLKQRNLVQSIFDFVKTGKLFLGICLGAQMLLSKSYEFGEHEGLNLVSGEVKGFRSNPEEPLKIPHIGWNRLRCQESSWKKTILDGLNEGEQMYFIHSFYLEPSNKDHCLAYTDYGGYHFCSVIAKDNIYGCQMHPEKSATSGLKLLKNFIELVKDGRT